MLKHRLLSGFFLAAVFIASILWAPWMVMLAILWVIVLASQQEFIRMVCPAALPRPLRLLAMGLGLLLLAALFADTRPWHAPPLGLWVLLGATWILILAGMSSQRPDASIEAAGLVLSLLYIVICLGLITHVTWNEFGLAKDNWPHPSTGARSRILYILWVVKLSDVGAYTAGMTLGRRRLCPRLSPAKTWEGLAGGVAGGILASLFAVWVGSLFDVLRFGFVHAAVLGLLLALVGVAGDLSESMFKRKAGMKDSGAGFPGLGGILDMVDSVLPVAPVMLLYMNLTGVA